MRTRKPVLRRGFSSCGPTTRSPQHSCPMICSCAGALAHGPSHRRHARAAFRHISRWIFPEIPSGFERGFRYVPRFGPKLRQIGAVLCDNPLECGLEAERPGSPPFQATFEELRRRYCRSLYNDSPERRRQLRRYAGPNAGFFLRLLQMDSVMRVLMKRPVIFRFLWPAWPAPGCGVIRLRPEL